MKWPFIGGAYSGRSLNANASTCFNWFIEPASKGQDAMLVPTPGYTLLSTSTGGTALPIRGMLYPGSGNFQYCVQGDRFAIYNLSTGIWTVNAFPLSTSSGPVSMEINDTDGVNGFVVFCDGVAAYSYNIASAAIVNLTSLYGFVSNTVCFLDGRFIVDDQVNPGRFYYSGIYDGLFTNQFNFATQEGSPDYLRAVLTDRRELWLFGDLTTEVWWSTSDANLPFQRSQGGFIHMGIAAPYTAKRFDNSVIWLGRNERGELQVVRAGDGMAAEVVSPPELNFSMAGLVPCDAYAMVYQLGGHEFYVLTFPTSNRTYVLDSLTKEWHVWRSGATAKHLAQCIASARISGANTILMGLIASDRSIYRLSDTAYTDNGTAIQRQRTSSHGHDERERIRLANFQLDVEAGPSSTVKLSTTVAVTSFPAGDFTVSTASSAGIVAGDAIAIALASGRLHTSTVTGTTAGPTISFNTALPETASLGAAVTVYASEVINLSWSKDGGNTFGTAVAVHIGTPLTKRFRAIVRKLGNARNWTFRVETNATVKVAILGAYAKTFGDDRDEPG